MATTDCSWKAINHVWFRFFLITIRQVHQVPVQNVPTVTSQTWRQYDGMRNKPTRSKSQKWGQYNCSKYCWYEVEETEQVFRCPTSKSLPAFFRIRSISCEGVGGTHMEKGQRRRRSSPVGLINISTYQQIANWKSYFVLGREKMHSITKTICSEEQIIIRKKTHLFFDKMKSCRLRSTVSRC